MIPTETITAAKKVHLQVFVFQAGPRGAREIARNFCAAYGDLGQPLTGKDPIHGPGTTGTITCSNCNHALASLGQTLQNLIPLRADVLAAQARAYAGRRLEWHRPSFIKSVQAVADDLRRKAEEIERSLAHYQAADPGFLQGLGPAVALASQVQHQVLWMLANLNLDGLTTRAAELDQLAEEAK
jgi:hypothetical protein